MSTENITLLIVASILCGSNLVFAPLAAGMAKLFARFSGRSSPLDFSHRRDDAGMPYRKNAETDSPPGEDDAQPSSDGERGSANDHRTSHTRCTLKTEEAQMSKYK